MIEPSPLVVLYLGAGVVAVAKPSGEPVIAARGEPPEDCLHRSLERQLAQKLWIVHRIDRDASGVVLFALDAAAHRSLSLAFEQRRVTKTYRAFVHGTLEPRDGRIEAPLHAARKGKTRPAAANEPGAQPAVTDYRTLATWQHVAVSLVEAHPLTGRHHQVRVHLRSAGAPILFDPLYAKGREAHTAAPCARLALHALGVDVPNPRRSGRIVVECPLPPDLEALAAWLGSPTTAP